MRQHASSKAERLQVGIVTGILNVEQVVMVWQRAFFVLMRECEFHKGGNEQVGFTKLLVVCVWECISKAGVQSDYSLLHSRSGCPQKNPCFEDIRPSKVWKMVNDERRKGQCRILFTTISDKRVSATPK
jgi:hypothetical protein